MSLYPDICWYELNYADLGIKNNNINYRIAGYFPRSKFSQMMSFSFSRIFPNLKIH